MLQIFPFITIRGELGAGNFFSDRGELGAGIFFLMERNLVLEFFSLWRQTTWCSNYICYFFLNINKFRFSKSFVIFDRNLALEIFSSAKQPSPVNYLVPELGARWISLYFASS